MTTKNPTGYCPHCKQNVLLTREDIDVCLAIILLIFTAGIGLIIYIAIYYSKPENRCVHCNTIVEPKYNFPNRQTQARMTYQDHDNPYVYQEKVESKSNSNYMPLEATKAYSDKQRYCELCGAKIESENQKFCSNCGNKFDD
ncbi:MAG: zinc-ribbon domain-containing protein [Candidatus Lokiarchaeota archaeon]